MRLIGGPDPGPRVSASVLVEAVSALLEGAQRAVRLRVEGESVKQGARPSWLDAVCRIQVTGLASGSVVIGLDAPTLGAAFPERFGPDAHAASFGDPAAALDGARTAIDYFGEALATLMAQDSSSTQADRSLLDACVRFARAAGKEYTGLQLENVAGRTQPVFVGRDHVPVFERLRDQIPAPRALRVTGTLDTISASKTDILLRLDDGSALLGRLAQPDPEGLRSLFGTKVVVSGLAHFRASGRPSVFHVEHIGPAAEYDDLWTRSPAALPSPLEMVAHTVPQDNRTGVNNFFGTWPGDETTEDLLAALKELDG